MKEDKVVITLRLDRELSDMFSKRMVEGETPSETAKRLLFKGACSQEPNSLDSIPLHFQYLAKYLVYVAKLISKK